jgi:hypothetical protein
MGTGDKAENEQSAKGVFLRRITKEVKRGKQAKIKLAPNFICPVSRSRV